MCIQVHKPDVEWCLNTYSTIIMMCHIFHTYMHVIYKLLQSEMISVHMSILIVLIAT